MARSFLQQLRHGLSRSSRRTPRRDRRNRPGGVRLILETMEPRLAPATIYWNNPAGGDWSDPQNWNPHQVPGADDAAVIGYGNITVTHSGGNDTVSSLSAAGSFNLSGGSLAVGSGSVNKALTIGGTLTVAAGGSFSASGQTPSGGSFSNHGTVNLGHNASLNLGGGNLNITDLGTVTGDGALNFSSITVTLNADYSDAPISALGLSYSQVNGPGVLTNGAGHTLSLYASGVAAPLVNQGVLLAQASSGINGALTTAAGSRLSVLGGPFSLPTLTVANGFTNNAVIELTSATAAYLATLAVSSGALVNAAGASLNVLAGAGGTRILALQLDNRGSVTIAAPAILSGVSAQHTNSGTITINQGQTLSINGGTFTEAATATINGPGTLSLACTAYMSGAVSAAVVNAGTLNLGTATTYAILTLTSTYTQTTAGTLNIKIGGQPPAPGVNYDQLIVQGAAALRCAFRAIWVNGFIPAPGDVFLPVTFASLTTKFDAVNTTTNWPIGVSATFVYTTVSIHITIVVSESFNFFFHVTITVGIDIFVMVFAGDLITPGMIPPQSDSAIVHDLYTNAFALPGHTPTSIVVQPDPQNPGNTDVIFTGTPGQPLLPDGQGLPGGPLGSYHFGLHNSATGPQALHVIDAYGKNSTTHEEQHIPVPNVDANPVQGFILQFVWVNTFVNYGLTGLPDDQMGNGFFENIPVPANEPPNVNVRNRNSSQTAFFGSNLRLGGAANTPTSVDNLRGMGDRLPNGEVLNLIDPGPFQVDPSVGTHLAPRAAPATTAGTAWGVTVSALDDDGNVRTGYTGTVHFTSSDGQAVLPDDYTFTAADHGVHTFSVTLTTAGSQNLTATDTMSPTITGRVFTAVSPAALDHFVVSSSADAAGTVAGQAFDVAVTAQDAYGNTVTAYTGTVTFSSQDPYGATLPTDYTFTAGDHGVHTFAGGATLYTAGTQDVTVTDTTTATAGSDAIMVTAAPAVAFQVLAPAQAASGQAFDLTVIAVDAYGNTDTNYQGTVTFSSSDTDPGVVLPADYTFQASDAGVVTFAGGVTLVTAGDQTVTATDVDSGITGSATVTITSTGPRVRGGHGRDRLRSLLAAVAALPPSGFGLPPAVPSRPTGTDEARSSLASAAVDGFFRAAGPDGQDPGWTPCVPPEVAVDPLGWGALAEGPAFERF